MRSFTLATMAAAVQASAVANSFLATVDDNRAVELPNLLRFPVEANKVAVHRKGAAVRRQQTSELLNQQDGTEYLIALSMGTPGQQVKVDFDTGSDELWVNPDCTTSGTADTEAFCKSLGRFVASDSTVNVDKKGGIRYGKGEVQFNYVKDAVGLGSAKIVNQTFGAAFASNDLAEGIMGAGPDLNGFDNAPYPLVIDSLAQQGLINARAFSVDLRSVSSPRGAVIFGGADTKKFSGTLTKCPIVVPGPDGAVRYWITMDGLTVNTPAGKTRQVLSKGASLPIFPDTGATLGHLPLEVVNGIAAGFPGAQFDAVHNQHTVPCALRNEDKTVDFSFGAAKIKVPFNDFIWQAGPDLCLLGVVPTPASSKSWSLGDSFLRAAYAVFDQDNKNVWLAQSDDCGTNLVAFDKGAKAVTPLQGECGKPPVSSSSTTSSSTTTSSTSQTSSIPTSTGVTTSSQTSSIPTSTGVTTSSQTSSIPTSTGVTTSSQTSSIPTSTGVTSSSSVPTGTGITSSVSGSIIPTGSTSMPWSNMTTTAAPTYTSTYLTTTTYTITSCPPVVTNCPVGRVTTEVITAYTTWCPGEQTATNIPAQPTSQPSEPGHECPGPNCSQPGKPGNECPGPNCNNQPGESEQPGTPENQCSGPNCGSKPSGPAGGNQCPGPNCNNKPTPSVSGENKPTGSHQCPGPNCATPSGPATSSSGSDHQCPGGANCPHPTGGMMTTVAKPCPTCGGSEPSTTGIVTAGASEMFRISGVAAFAAVMAALIL